MSFEAKLRKTVGWRMSGKCSVSDPADFESTEGSKLQRIIAARPVVERYCDDCPVFQLCRAWADDDAAFEGIAAGRVYYRKLGDYITKDGTPAVSPRLVLDVVPRAELAGHSLMFDSRRPSMAHLVGNVRPGSKWQAARCGITVNCGTTGPEVERVLSLQRCPACYRVAGLFPEAPTKEVRERGA